jgi:hypothetical protein
METAARRRALRAAVRVAWESAAREWASAVDRRAAREAFRVRRAHRAAPVVRAAHRSVRVVRLPVPAVRVRERVARLRAQVVHRQERAEG